MRLSLSYDSGYKFDKLTLIDTDCFFVPFFNFIFQLWIYWELNFIIFSICFLLGYSSLWSDNGFDRLTRVDMDHFLSFFIIFFSFILQH